MKNFPLLAITFSLVLSSCGTTKFVKDGFNEGPVWGVTSLMMAPFTLVADAVHGGDFMKEYEPAPSSRSSSLDQRADSLERKVRGSHQAMER